MSTNEEEGRISNATVEGVHTVDTPEPHANKNVDVDDVSQADPIDDGDTFPRDYVLKLRDENAKYRQRAQDRDELAKQLHTALVTATGRLQDPSDLAFDEDHLRDPGKMVAAVDDLLATKPHLASRKPAGDIGQGVSVASDTFSLLGALRTNAS